MFEPPGSEAGVVALRVGVPDLDHQPGHRRARRGVGDGQLEPEREARLPFGDVAADHLVVEVVRALGHLGGEHAVDGRRARGRRRWSRSWCRWSLLDPDVSVAASQFALDDFDADARVVRAAAGARGGDERHAGRAEDRQRITAGQHLGAAAEEGRSRFRHARSLPGRRCDLPEPVWKSAAMSVVPERFVVVGAGAVGGVVGARLHQHGHEVVLVARGAHHDAIRAGGLRLDAPEESVTLALGGARLAGRRRLPRRRRRAARGEGPGHRRRPARARRGHAVRHADRVPAERRRERARGTAALPQRVRRLRRAARGAPRARRGRRERGADDRHPRHRSRAVGRRRHRARDRRGVRVVDVRLRAARRRHALEVRQAPQQPRQRDRRARRA